jgi:DNA repair protein SbcC/Rad50
MIVNNLSLKNFRQHKDTSIAFPRKAVIGLIGPNATGKSTLIEALEYALYGTKATRGTSKGLRWTGAANRQTLQVTLDFELLDKQYRVIRKESGAELWDLAHDDKPIAAGSDAVTQEVTDKILNMSREEFLNTYACNQNDLNRIGKMGGVERAQFILKVTGGDRIDKAINEGRTRKNARASEKKGIVAGIGEREPLQTEVHEANREITRLNQLQKNTSKETEAKSKLFDSAKANFETQKEAKKKDQAFRSDLTQKQSDIAQLKSERKFHSDDIVAAQEASAKLEVIEPQIATLPDLREKRDHLRDIAHKAATTERIKTSLENVTKQITRIETDVAATQKEIESYDPSLKNRLEKEIEDTLAKVQNLRAIRVANEQSAKKDAEAARSTIAKTDKKIQALQNEGPNGKCPTCTRKLDKQFQHVITSLHEEKAEAEKILASAINIKDEPSQEELSLIESGKNLRTQFNTETERFNIWTRNTTRVEESRIQLKQKLEEQKALSSDLQENAPKVTFSQEELDSVEKQIKELSAIEQQAAQYRSSIAKLPRSQTALAEIDIKIKALDSTIEEIQIRIKEINFDPTSYDSAESELNNQNNALSAAREEAARISAQLEGETKRLDRAQQSLAEYDARANQVTELTQEIADLDEAIQGLVSFRREQAEAIRPDLQERTARYIFQFTDGRYTDIVMNDTFGITMIDGENEMEVVSGGSEDIAALATRLALAEISAERSGAPITLLSLDEPFASLAEQWRRNVIDQIRTLSDRFEQVIVITHQDEIRNAVDVAYIVEFDPAEGYSTVTEA